MSGKAHRYLLDTNALIALGNGDAALVKLLAGAEYIATSVICKIEYLVGIADNLIARCAFEALLREIDVIDLADNHPELIDSIVSVRASNRHIKLPDAIVMASAGVCGAVLVTNDRQLKGCDVCEVLDF